MNTLDTVIKMRVGIAVLAWLFATVCIQAQDPRPELIYFRFDETGQMATPNKANPATSVTPQGVLNGGLTMGQTGQFGSALVGVGGGSGNIVTTGWTTNLGGSSWTISMWLNQVNGTYFGYYFGDPSAGSFRCFNQGVAGNNNILLRGPFSQVLVTGVAPGPTVVHFVYDASANQIRAYKNGAWHRTVNQGSLNIQGSGGQFGVGAYSGGGGSGSFPLGALLDEFRIYNRALSDAEIAATWNKDVDCFFPEGLLQYSILDKNMQPTAFVEMPGYFNLDYTVGYPNEESNVTMTVNLYSVSTNQLVFTTVLTDFKPLGQTLHNTQMVVPPPTLPSGYYIVEVIFNSKNSCLNYGDYVAPRRALLFIPAGTELCEVWPGDTDNNGIVNYPDRRSLNQYIFDANLSPIWLNGPARFDPEGGMAFLEWRPQVSAPWATPDGCYKDTDGNGVINNFDYLAIKLNWMKTTPGYILVPRDGARFSAISFDMDQNYPNPFNPATTLRFGLPEASHVVLTVSDALGRQVATLVNGRMDFGTHTVAFDGSALSSGTYMATIAATGQETGMTFRKTIKMVLSK